MLVKAEKISRQYYRKTKESNVFTALKEMDLVLKGGELTEIMGRSGSGKSTLLNVLAGLLSPTGGQVLYDGKDIYTLEDGERSRFRNRHIGVIPQGQSGLSSLTVLENVLLPSAMYGEKREEKEALLWLERLGISDLKDAFPNELSGGEMRRMAIARALFQKPAVLLADEPSSDLDDENTELALCLLREAADRGAAVLLVTHEREAEAYADRLYRMNEGVFLPWDKALPHGR